MEKEAGKKLIIFETMKDIFVLLVILFGLPITAQSKELAMTCNMQGGSRVFIVIFPETLESELVYKKTVINGLLTVEDNFFNFVYPPASSRYEIRISVNRRTGALMWEHGTPPFGAFNRRNVHRKGHCDIRL